MELPEYNHTEIYTGSEACQPTHLYIFVDPKAPEYY